MLSENQIDRINTLIRKETLNYTGPINYNIDIISSIDFKFQILGYREMIKLGSPIQMVSVKLILTKFKDELSKMIFNRWKDETEDEISKILHKNLYYLKLKFQNEISSLLDYFNINEDVVISEVSIEDSSLVGSPITEQKKTRSTTRSVVKDIVSILKSKQMGTFYLPENDFYEFKKYPHSFSIELDLNYNKKNTGYKIDASYYTEDDTIHISIDYNPKTLIKNMYGIIGELNEIITHELEHGMQIHRGEINHDFNEVNDNLEYYLQPHEIMAQIKGFKRLSNLTKKPFKDVVTNWFITHEDIHGLNTEEQDVVISKILLNYGKTKH